MNDDVDDTTLNENAKRFLHLYDSKSKDFQRYFAILVGASLFVLIFMLFPFVVTQYMQYNVSISKNTISQLIQQVESDLDLYPKVTPQINKGIDNLTDSISNGTCSLRNYILSFDAPEFRTREPCHIQPEMIQPVEYPECGLRTNMTSSTEEERMECNVREKVEEQFQGYNQTLLTEVVKPLQQLSINSQEAIGINQLITDTKKLLQEMNQTLADNPTFWETVRTKGDFYIQLDGKVENFWTKYKLQIENHNSTLQEQLRKLDGEKTKLDKDFAKYNNELGNITKSLEEFESPIGRLTIGFDDLVMFFPLALASGFLVVSSMLTEAMNFRREYLTFHPKKDNIRGSLSSQDIARTAPLWVDYQDTGQNKIGRFAILFLPLLIYIIACALIFFSWWGIAESSLGDIPEVSLGDIPNYRPVFAGAYIITGSLVFPYCYLRIIREYHQK